VKSVSLQLKVSTEFMKMILYSHYQFNKRRDLIVYCYHITIELNILHYVSYCNVNR